LLNFIATELHKQFTPLFSAHVHESYQASRREALRGRFELVDQKLGAHAYLAGDALSLADLYLYVVSRWAPLVQVPLEGLSSLARLTREVHERPSAIAARAAEGLRT
jgi:glutathione S-transferase